MSTVPFLDVGATYRELKQELDDAVDRAIGSGWYLLGNELAQFEDAFASCCGVEAAIGVANGLDALTLSLRAVGVQAGDEVIVPSNTYIATWLAVTAVGGTIVPVEPDEISFNIDPARIQSAITPRTRAIICVHLYGLSAEIDAIMSIAATNGIYVVEDSAQAHGALYRGRRTGSLGHVAAWSFYPGKNLGAFGDGGAVTTSDHEIAERVRLLRNYGSVTKYVHEVQGVNSRLDEIQAAVLRVKLARLDEWNSRRRTSALRYATALQGHELVLPQSMEQHLHAWHLYVVRVSRGLAARNSIRKRLAAGGVETIIHYPTPPHLQPAYKELGFPVGSFPIAEAMANEVLSLPIGPHLTADQQEQVISVLRSDRF